MELKDEHKPKKESLFEHARREFREKYGEPVKTIYRVEEHLGSYDYDGCYIPGRARLVDASEWKNTREEAEELMAKMKPSSSLWGAFLKIRTRTLYRKWIPPQDGYWKETWV